MDDAAFPHVHLCAAHSAQGGWRTADGLNGQQRVHRAGVYGVLWSIDEELGERGLETN